MSPSLPHQVGDGSLRAISYLFIFLLVAVVALRFYARLLAKSKLGADDVLIVPAALTCVILCILSIIC